jgi:hypothetical protein
VLPQPGRAFFVSRRFYNASPAAPGDGGLSTADLFYHVLLAYKGLTLADLEEELRRYGEMGRR